VRVCENITVTNYRLSASANAIKFSEGNIKGVQHVTIDNCVIRDDSSGFSFAASNGGFVRDVAISNLTLNLRRFNWFWGLGGFMGMTLKTPAEYHGKPISKDDRAPGSIQNSMIRNIIVHAKGRAHIDGHPNSWIDGLTVENIKFYIGTDPSAPFDWTTNAMQFYWVKNLKLKDVEVPWEEPASDEMDERPFGGRCQGSGDRRVQRATGLSEPRGASHHAQERKRRDDSRLQGGGGYRDLPETERGGQPRHLFIRQRPTTGQVGHPSRPRCRKVGGSGLGQLYAPRWAVALQIWRRLSILPFDCG